MGGAQHYAVKLKKELFPTDIMVDIPFSSDRRDMFSEKNPCCCRDCFEQFPTVNGKMDVHFNDCREKITF